MWSRMWSYLEENTGLSVVLLVVFVVFLGWVMATATFIVDNHYQQQMLDKGYRWVPIQQGHYEPIEKKNKIENNLMD
ncbi:MAG: hypothetical protein AABY32_00690 [Nanoarchaeota archaeon]